MNTVCSLIHDKSQLFDSPLIMGTPLISSYGQFARCTSPKINLFDPASLSDWLCDSLELRLSPEECNTHTSNTRDIFGRDSELDLPLYEYSAPPQSGFIRLLTFNILETPEGRLITGSLSHHSFEEATELGYNALSYAWGHPRRTHHIICNEARVPITANLADWFRYCDPVAKRSRIIWIDSICINQKDVVERGYQVRQMREVYRNAQLVVAWVGKAVDAGADGASVHDEISEELEAIKADESMWYDRELVTGALWHHLQGNRGLQRNIWADLALIIRYIRVQVDRTRGIATGILCTIRDLVLSDSTASQWFLTWYFHIWQYNTEKRLSPSLPLPITLLFRHPYFTRRWIIQELRSVHSNARIAFHWDRALLDGEAVLITMFRDLGYNRKSENFELELSKSLLLLGQIYEPHSSKHDSRSQAELILRLLANTHNFDCSDARDGVYALIGLYPTIEVNPDYSSSVYDVYTSFAAKLVKTAPGCVLLLLTCAIWHRSDIESWPTWIPDWRSRIKINESQSILQTMRSDTIDDLPQEWEAYIEVDIGHRPTLKAVGLYVGFVVGERMHHNHNAGWCLYSLITESCSPAIMYVPQANAIQAGDLIFDLGKLYILRPVSPSESSCRLLAFIVPDHLFLLQGEDEIETMIHRWLLAQVPRVSSQRHPETLDKVCTRASTTLLRLREMFNEEINFMWLLYAPDVRGGPRGKALSYAASPEFPRSESLVTCNIV